MVDIVDGATRSRMMSSIQGKNTQPEMVIRRFLHRKGFRYRLHKKDLPGKPDLVLSRYRLVIFVHGCFWHRHKDCFYATSPATRKDFWQRKLKGNVKRDNRQYRDLIESGWRVLIIWECGVRHNSDTLNDVVLLIRGNDVFIEWPDSPPRQRFN